MTAIGWRWIGSATNDTVGQKQRGEHGRGHSTSSQTTDRVATSNDVCCEIYNKAVVLVARFSRKETPDQTLFPEVLDDLICDDLRIEHRATTQKQRRLEPGDIQELVAQYVAGSTINELAVSWKIHRTTVMDHLNRNNVTTRRHVRKMTNQQVALAAQLYKVGLSLAKLGKKYNVDAQTMSKELKSVGTQIRPRRGT